MNGNWVFYVDRTKPGVGNSNVATYQERSPAAQAQARQSSESARKSSKRIEWLCKPSRQHSGSTQRNLQIILLRRSNVLSIFIRGVRGRQSSTNLWFQPSSDRELPITTRILNEKGTRSHKQRHAMIQTESSTRKIFHRATNIGIATMLLIFSDAVVACFRREIPERS